MRCKWCGEEIALVHGYAGTNTSVYLAERSSSYCEEAPRGRNPLGTGFGKWHDYDEAYDVEQILKKYNAY